MFSVSHGSLLQSKKKISNRLCAATLQKGKDARPHIYFVGRAAALAIQVSGSSSNAALQPLQHTQYDRPL
jgi:hypothetical protein